jgi:hypothetical protein
MNSEVTKSEPLGSAILVIISIIVNPRPCRASIAGSLYIPIET